MGPRDAGGDVGDGLVGIGEGEIIGDHPADVVGGGAEAALVELGRGLLEHPENGALRLALRGGSLTREAFFNELLRLIYRVLFLFVAEDRGLLLAPDAAPEARARYDRLYSSRRLRDLSLAPRASGSMGAWAGLCLVLRALWDGDPALGLPALGSGLFDPAEMPHLTPAKLSDERLFAAIRRLTEITRGGRRARVNYGDLGAEELGRAYESLLELHPRLDPDAGHFELSSAAGNERKTTGSYYTPAALIERVLDAALEPVVGETLKGKVGREAEGALLALRVCDPACGSGHFLVAAARRLAGHLARARSGDEEPGPIELRRALRDVIDRCIFGVDASPMVVELCKVSLWMEALEPGRPLSSLDAHIQCGDALLGATPALLARGIPDEAFDPIEEDDKKIARSIKRQNRRERSDLGLPVASPQPSTPEQARFLADLWCAAFVWKKEPGPLRDLAPTEATYRRLSKNPESAPAELRAEVRRLREAYRFFHWHLAFPHVLRAKASPIAEGDPCGWLGGFDLVLGNPPWERIKLQEQEFFANRSEAIAGALNAADRKRQIRELETRNPALWTSYRSAARRAEGASHFIRNSGRFPLCGKGDINTYSIFSEHNLNMVSPSGRAGFIVPSGIITEDTTRLFFDSLMARESLVSFWELENVGFFSAGRGHMLRFGLVTLCGSGARATPDFFFQGQSLTELADPERHFTVTRDDIHLLNPNSRTCPIFRTRRDARLAKLIQERVPVLIRDATPGQPEVNPWDARLWSMFHMTADAALFRSAEQLPAAHRGRARASRRGGPSPWAPLYEAKMISLYTHRHGDYADAPEGQRPHRLPEIPPSRLASPTYLVSPFWWVPGREVEEQTPPPAREWILAFRDVTDARASARTVVAAVIPKAGVANSLSIITPADPSRAIALVACLSSFVLDYAARQKIAGLHLNFLQMKQLPVLPPAVFEQRCGWSDATVLDWIRPRVLELTYTAWDLQPFARDCGYEGSPFRWDAERRAMVRAELDAAFFHLYGLSRADADYVMSTFPIVKRQEEQQFGEYRARRLILERFDAMAQAAAARVPYATRLNPPPADPRLAHPPLPAPGLHLEAAIAAPAEP